MRWLLPLFLISGCAFKIEPGDDWLPLVGEAPSLDALPQVTMRGFNVNNLFLADDGRVWLGESSLTSPDVTLHSLEASSQTLFIPGSTTFTLQGELVTAVALDDSRTRYQVELKTPGQPPRVSRVVELAEPAPFVRVTRGSDYFVMEDQTIYPPSPSPSPSFIHLAYDDGHDDAIPKGDEQWTQAFLSNAAVFDPSPPTAGPRYLVVEGYRPDYTQLFGVYDLQARQLFPILEVAPLDPNQPGAPLYYDQPRQRLWVCGAKTYLVDLPTRAVDELPFSCIDLRFDPLGTSLLQDNLGAVHALDADGNGEVLDTIGLRELRATHGRQFVYSEPGFDDYVNQSYGGWLGDRRVIQSGNLARFSADGSKLYWLESISGNNTGDLYSMDVGTFVVHHLVRNVYLWAELPDGRLVAAADAAVSGPWNRVVLVDEAQHESRWLAENAQYVFVLGDQVVVVRRLDNGDQTAFLVPVPPR